ncbi:hypothetical protein [Vulcanisaeta souniana]|uniref:Uncharacterized protein n=1 Tax=Vulcanisaeta souniana JCM 11219 TaxID=1293586 RepID=A0A830EH03_9CREN|nr:hypothetical protein [Vulcanisaeta souniana]BDR91767.1 hypothetical protein Vsou_08600 [Vulcanisaeta souniana JCM 11219]GGI70541.1 hypothetical protein GCM10007112_04370 [Vulcanisaeta souniana JCM 11219]
MSIELARKLIEDWLTQRGLRVVDKLNDREVILAEGNNTVYLRISTEEFPTESYITDELSNVMRNRFNYNKAYIAFPQSARGLINGRLFRSSRVGIYIYDLSSTDPEKAVEELIPSIPIQLQQVANDDLRRRIDELEKIINNLRSDPLNADSKSLVRDINELKDRLARIEHELGKLTERVSKLEGMVRSSDKNQSMNPQVSTMVSDELPDFLNNNPWVNVLKKRGGEG